MYDLNLAKWIGLKYILATVSQTHLVTLINSTVLHWLGVEKREIHFFTKSDKKLPWSQSYDR
jgi:hypothetical protein